MKWFMRKKPAAQPPEVQLRDQEGHPFGALDRYVPLRRGELELYRAIREAVPIVDAALMKLVRLCGGDRKSTRLNSSHDRQSRMPSSA